MPNEEKDQIKGPDFVIVDRRAGEAGGEEAAAQDPEKATEAEEQPGEQPASTEEAEEAASEAVDVYSTLGFVITLLHEQAWHLLGLVPHPITKEYRKDLDQAQVAIDCVAFLVGQLHGRVPDDDMRRLRTLVSDLQVNFAKQKAAG